MSRLRAVSTETVALAAVGGGVVVAVAAVLLGGFLGSSIGALTGVLYLLAWALPAVGIVLVVAAIVWAGDAGGGTHGRLGAVEPADHASDDAVGDAAATNLSRAARERYACRAGDEATAVRSTLVEGAVRVVRTRHGLSAERAGEAVREGAWTDDPVAAAFLADEPAYPLVERLRGVVDPGAAYRRRVRRTVAAIERVDRTRDTEPTEVAVMGPTEGEP